MTPVWPVRFPGAAVDRLLAHCRQTGQRLAFVPDPVPYLRPERGGGPVVPSLCSEGAAPLSAAAVDVFAPLDLEGGPDEDLLISITPGRIHVSRIAADAGSRSSVNEAAGS